MSSNFLPSNPQIQSRHPVGTVQHYFALNDGPDGWMSSQEEPVPSSTPFSDSQPSAGTVILEIGLTNPHRITPS